jgi:phosphoribosylaminoimidazole-succinocarboxamide synthase
VPNHVISASDVPPEWAGRAIRCHRLEMIPVECIARGYLAGLGLASYQKSGSISGVPLPPSLTEGAKLPEPIFTPTTKAAARHDEPLTYAETVSLVGEEMSAELERITLEIYRWGAALAAERGVLIADTKQEFGRAADGSLMLADEVLTPDSSRFWPADSWVPGRPQHSLDKQFLRDWSATLDWDRPRPGRQFPRRSWRPRGPATWTFTSASSGRPGKGDRRDGRPGL